MNIGNFFIKYKKQEWGFDIASSPIDVLYKKFNTSEKGLNDEDIPSLLKTYGGNEIYNGQEKFFIIDFLERFASPLVIILLIIASFSFFFGDKVSTIVISAMIFMSVTISFVQERRAKKSAKKLSEMVQTMCTIRRGEKVQEIAISMVVPGDVVVLSAGDIIPGDIRIVSSKDLFINQSSLSGESFPVEKFATVDINNKNKQISPEQKNMAFMGTSVVSGIGTGIVIYTGQNTIFGRISRKLSESNSKTLFDKQINEFTSAMIKIMVLVVVIIMSIYTLQHRDFLKSFLFVLAVVVQITPETLPMILTLNLSRGAAAMSRKRVIVKRLNSVQNLGAMDVLCSDKTGTLTKNEIILEKHINIRGEADESVFMFGYINSYYQTGIKNLMNGAVLSHKREDLHEYTKIDEIPFDFERRINSVIVKNSEEILISVGAPEEVIRRCSKYEEGGINQKLSVEQHSRVLNHYFDLSKDGFRVLAVAYKLIEEKPNDYTTSDENDLIFKGYMAFFDPPKSDVKKDIEDLRNAGIDFKIITGDNEYVTQKICKDLNIEIHGIVLGGDIDKMSDLELSKIVETTTVFARATPEQKERVIKSLKSNGHTVGYLGDGINDALSLRTADVGISVNNAVDVAKESAGIVLLEKDLHSLVDGIFEGRRVFGNFMKYIQVTSMVNVGYMISTIVAGFILPFLPMNPVQMLLNNYLYEVGQTAIPSDNVDREYIKKPRKWSIKALVKYMLTMGVIVSIFDFIMFGILWFVFKAYSDENIFQNGWFLQTMIAQVLLIFVIRAGRESISKNLPSKLLVLMVVIILGVVFALPFTPLATALHLMIMPTAFYPIVFIIVFIYLSVVYLLRNRYI